MVAHSASAPFLDVRSFVPQEPELAPDQGPPATRIPVSRPFLSVYEQGEQAGVAEPHPAEYTVLLHQLYDEELDETLFELAQEAAELYTAAVDERSDNRRMNGADAERMLEQHFAPVRRQAEAMLDALASDLGARDIGRLTDSEVDSVIARYTPGAELSPSFEHLFGGLKKIVSGAVKTAVNLANQGLGAVATLGLGPILSKLKALVSPLLKKVLQLAISRLPGPLQPVARTLAQRLQLSEVQEETSSNDAVRDVAEIQLEFNRQIAEILFAPDEVTQELEISRAVSEVQAAPDSALRNLDEARARFIGELGRLKEGEDPTEHVEQFIPAILPALKLGIRVAGRKRVVKVLADLIGTVIRRFVGPQQTPALSQAIVDAGLHLMNLEASPDQETGAAGAAIASTVEDTVRRATLLPEYILDDQELFEGFALEAVEQAAAGNLPPVLTEATYSTRPDLREATTLRGTWVLMPLGGDHRYKKYSRIVRTTITPHQAGAIESFGGDALADYLHEELGLPPGADVTAEVHLYEAVPGTMLSEIGRLEQATLARANGNRANYRDLHPLTPQAAGLLLGEPALGRAASARHLATPRIPAVGQRFYALATSGMRPVARPGARRRSRVRLTVDFPRDEIRVYAFLSEVRAQALAVKLREKAHVGALVAGLRRFIERGVHALTLPESRRVKLIHEAAPVANPGPSLGRLPGSIPAVLAHRLEGWLLKALSEFFRTQAARFISATEDPADGVTLVITLRNAPGLAVLRQGLQGRLPSLAAMKLPEDAPAADIQIVPGWSHD